jgi:hypothetical protein
MIGNCEHCNNRDVMIVTQPNKSKGQSLCPACYDKYLDSFTQAPQPPRQDVDDERKYGKY